MRGLLAASTACAAVLAAALYVSPASAAAYDPMVYRVQIALNQQGFDAGAPDGKMGPHTRAAIEAYQRTAGLSPTGVLTRQLATRIEGNAPPRSAARDAQRRDQRADRRYDRDNGRLSQPELIRQTQHELDRLGYHLTYEGGRLNGETSDAIRDYQQRHNMTVTGMPSAQLLAEMRSDRTPRAQDGRVGSNIQWNDPRAASTVAPTYYPPPVQAAPVAPAQPVQCADFLHQSLPGGSDYNGPPVPGCN